MGGALHEVQIKNEPLYLRRSKSAMMQSTMWGFGVRKYTASMSRCTSRRSSMRSMSATGQGSWFMATGAARTGDVGIEHVILLDYIVDKLAAVFVHNQDLPLRRSLGQRDQTGGRGVGRTSPRVVLLMVLRMTVGSVS
jgi:hypothetical protein